MNTVTNPDKSFPVRRFNLDQIPKFEQYWHSAAPFKTQLFNSLSASFPVGEKFFIETVRKFTNIVEDENLKNQVIAFIGQEVNHTRVHHQELNTQIKTTN